MSRVFVRLLAGLSLLAAPLHAQISTTGGLEKEWQKQSAPFDLGSIEQGTPASASPVGRLLPSRWVLAASPKTRAGSELGVDTSAMDRTVRPQDDFFRFVNGTWLRTSRMPDDKSVVGAFDALRDKTRDDVFSIIEQAAEGTPVPGSDAQKIADLYKSFMDTEQIEALGLQPIAADLAAIQGLQSKEALAELLARARAQGIQVPIDLEVDVDNKDISSNIPYIVQNGLGLPEREYYLKEDSDSAKIREKYLEYVAKLLTLTGEANAAQKAETVFNLEKALALAHWPKEEMRDPGKKYNKMTQREVAAAFEGFDWKTYFRAAQIPETQPIVVQTPSYFTAFAKVAQERPLEDWKLYLKVRTLQTTASLLPDAFVQAEFEYKGRALSGQAQIKPRWERGTRLVNGSIGEIVGKTYVAKHFPESSKKRMVELVENLRQAYAERIQDSSWLTEQTRQEALVKLSKFTPKIGYPDKWRDYSTLTIKSGDLVGNIKRIAKLEYDRNLGKLGRPVDRTEWHMSPSEVNAYYNPDQNEIVFPAAILQPPFFNPAADDAVNYGAIGGVIGHEMGHGFDDKGSQYDGDGALRDWWTAADHASFEKRTKKLVGQYDAFEPLAGLHVNGKYTLGENIGDLAGLEVSYLAYQMSLRKSPAPVIDGFTGDQRFLLGWGQVWRGKMREQEQRTRINTDKHSPPEYRVNGVLRNMPAFYQAFGVKKGDKLYLPEKERVSIW